MNESVITHFVKYTGVGVINTVIHWVVFLILYAFATTQQFVCNFIAFLVAVSFSFYANSKWTFKVQRSIYRYSAYILLMGLLAAGVGKLSDILLLPPLLTLLISSGASLVVGFVISKAILTVKISL